jgi:murein DD-endopeptidase MepM/ murein hydrolase activator NlpD
LLDKKPLYQTGRTPIFTSMNWNKLSIFPVMGEPLSAQKALPLDFTAGNAGLRTVDLGDTASFDAFVFQQLHRAGKTYGHGGYLEKRDIYRRSEVFATTQEDFRNIHLGIDIWTAAGSPIFAPLDGKVHSFQDNEGFGNYGPTIILEHQVEGQLFYTLYGHLRREDLQGLEVGQVLRAGEAFCQVGPYPENGDWPPHLHFQLIWDLEGNWGDYPGVAAEKELDFYAKNCPDPSIFLGLNEH